ncbi:MAG: hypothetical protein IKA32_02765 [Lentisphaeria bacterium]|nr:hypothetical protein [Lentisphaeria bacterium]
MNDNDIPEQYRAVIKEIRRRGYKDPYFILRLARLIREWLEQAGMEWKPRDHAAPVCAGCGGVAKYQLPNGKWYCADTPQRCPGIKEKQKASLKRTWREKRNEQHL